MKKLFKRIVGDLSANTSSTIPLSVEAATRCNCYFRALRWLEQYGLPNKNRLTNVEVQNATNFDHESYYLLEVSSLINLSLVSDFQLYRFFLLSEFIHIWMKVMAFLVHFK